MDPLFTGSSRRRPVINLGRGSSNTSASILEQARAERKQREDFRRLEHAACLIQSVYRGRRHANAIRRELSRQFDALLPLSPSNILQATRLLAVMLVYSPTARKFAQSVDSPDQRLILWVQTLAANQCYIDTQLWSSSDANPSSWIVNLRSIISLLVSRISLHPGSRHTLLFLELIKQLTNPSHYTSIVPCQQLTIYLVKANLYRHLANYIIQSTTSIASAVTISILPIRTFFKDNDNDKSIQQQQRIILTNYATDILCTPYLFKNMKERSRLLVRSELPLPQLFDVIENSDQFQNLSIEQSIALLMHLISITKLNSLTMKESVIAYFSILCKCCDEIQKQTASLSVNYHGITADLDHADSSDMDIDPPKSTNLHLIDLYHAAASQITSSFILDAHTFTSRFSSSLRPFFAVLFTLLCQAFPEKRNDIVSCIIYNQAGFVRELWRGWLRTSNLSRRVSGGREGSNHVASALTDPACSQDWNILILLSELYLKSLSTLGDDEFFASGSRNPLTIDEVIEFSALLRNICFALYWHETKIQVRDGELVMQNCKVNALYLRALITDILGQIHARDSRKPFTPEGHWIMTSQFDLELFLKTVIYEDMQVEENVSQSNSNFAGHRRPRIHVPKSQINIISPRLGVLNNIPFVIPFESRVRVFQQFVDNDAMHHQDNILMRKIITVRRDHLEQDSFNQMASLGAALKGNLAIRFIDEFGLEEAGIDGGGLFKELMTRLVNGVFDTDRAMWVHNSNQEIYPSPTMYAKESESLRWYKFLGQLIGKTLYSGILINAPFAGFFVSKWLEKKNLFDNLRSFDPDLYSGLLKLKYYPGDVENDLGMFFAIDIEEFGAMRTVDLKANGRNIPVTNANRLEYITLVSHYKLNMQIREQSEAFVSGLYDLIDPRWLRMFNESEIKKLIGGVDDPIDLDDLKRNTNYGGGLDESDKIIIDFWAVVDEMDQDQRSKLIRYVTSCARPPLLGFSELQPKFAIRDGGADISRLPTASTCVNLLKLPRYTSRQMLKEKLTYAINAEAGFDLS